MDAVEKVSVLFMILIITAAIMLLYIMNLPPLPVPSIQITTVVAA